jgi:transposase
VDGCRPGTRPDRVLADKAHTSAANRAHVLRQPGHRQTALIHDRLARHPRFHIHFAPTGSSWINQVERWFGYLADRLTRRGVHESVQALEADLRAWIEDWNRPDTVRMEEDCRGDRRILREISKTDFRRGTLVRRRDGE